MLKNKKLLIALLVLVAAIAALAGISLSNTTETSAGNKEISVTITHGDGSVNEQTLATDAEYLRGALEEAALIEGVESDYGLYVLTVDGETCDEANQEWWCFTMGGEMLMTGVDTTPIADGDAYEIALIVGY